MGLDVGVVKISYLDRPENPIYDFLWSLAIDPDDQTWGYSWEGNAFYEFMRENLDDRVTEYVEEKALNHADSDKLMAWVESLHWDDDTIMLHLNW